MTLELKQYYSEIAKQYDYLRTNQKLIDYFVSELQQKIINNFLKDVKETYIALESGCGTGRVSLNIHNRFRRYFALDISYEMLSVFKKKIPGSDSNLYLLNSDINSIPFKDDCVDSVIAIRVLWHIEDNANILKEINRVLKLGGVIILDFPNRCSYFWLLYLLRKKKLSNLPPVFHSSWKQIKTMLSGFGFDIVDTKGLLTTYFPSRIFNGLLYNIFFKIETKLSTLNPFFSKYIMIKARKVRKV